MPRFICLFVVMAFLLSYNAYTKDGGDGKGSGGKETSSTVKVGKDLDVKISSLTINRQTTPSFPGGKHGSKGAGDKWLVVEVEFDVKKQKWLDEAEISWLVLIQGESKTPIELRQKTAFVDLKKGKNVASAFVRPKFFERHSHSETAETNRVFVLVEMRVNGKVIDRSWKGSNSLKKVVEEGSTTKRMENELLPRSKTPFANVDFDYYANEKPDLR